MISLDDWLLFLALSVMAAATPGPGNLTVVTVSAGSGVEKGLAVIVGILAGLLSLSLLAVLGFHAVLQASAELFRGLQYAGALYIGVLGIRMLFRRVHTEFPDRPSASGGRQRLFLRGMLVSMANPKSIGFFAALLPPFIDPGGNVELQYVVLVATQLAAAFAVLLLYCLSTRKLSPWIAGHESVFNRTTGGLFVGMAAYFAWPGRL